MKFFDRNKKEIVAGMYIRHVNGDVELVYESLNGILGLNASNELYLENHLKSHRELYPLYNFKMSEWTIVE